MCCQNDNSKWFLHLLKENSVSVSGKVMAMDFVRRIRSQHKFNTPEELSAQITKDCQKAREILAAISTE